MTERRTTTEPRRTTELRSGRSRTPVDRGRPGAGRGWLRDLVLRADREDEGTFTEAAPRTRRPAPTDRSAVGRTDAHGGADSPRPRTTRSAAKPEPRPTATDTTTPPSGTRRRTPPTGTRGTAPPKATGTRGTAPPKATGTRGTAAAKPTDRPSPVTGTHRAAAKAADRPSAAAKATDRPSSPTGSRRAAAKATDHSSSSSGDRSSSRAGVRGGATQVGGARPETARSRSGPVLRLVVGHAPLAPKTPFVLLVLSLLGGGLVALLLLSSASSADAFTQRTLQRDNRELSIREQELGRQVAASEAPGALAERARKMGLVEGAEPGFLVVGPDGSAVVKGSPVPATSPPPPPTPTPTPTPTPSGSPVASGSPAPAGASPRPSGTPKRTSTAGPPRSTTTPTPTPGGTR